MYTDLKKEESEFRNGKNNFKGKDGCIMRYTLCKCCRTMKQNMQTSNGEG